MTSLLEKALTAKKLFKCAQCSFSSSRKYQLITHIKTHFREKTFKCDQCSYSSTKRCVLTVHKRTHTGEKPYKCDQCSYSSTHSAAVTAHKRSHTGEKPFKCDQCSFSTAYRTALTIHKRKHTGEKPFKCDQCSYSSTNCSALTAHKRSHTGEKPFKCGQCSYSASLSSARTVHKRTHTGEKPFKCDQCSYSSTSCSSLTLHKRRHTGEKPYKCDQCSYSSASCGSLTVHKRTHSAEKPLKYDHYGNLEVQFPNRCRPGTQNSFSLKRELENRTSSKSRLYEVPNRRIGIKPCKVELCRLTTVQIQSYQKFYSFVAIKFENEYRNSICGTSGTSLLGLKFGKVKSFGRHPSSDEDNKCETDLRNCVDHPHISEATVFDEESFKLDVSDIKTEPTDFTDRDELQCPNSFFSNQQDTSVKIELPDYDESVSILTKN